MYFRVGGGVNKGERGAYCVVVLRAHLIETSEYFKVYFDAGCTGGLYHLAKRRHNGSGENKIKPEPFKTQGSPFENLHTYDIQRFDWSISTVPIKTGHTKSMLFMPMYHVLCMQFGFVDPTPNTDPS